MDTPNPQPLSHGDDPPVALAKRAIRLTEQKLAEEFGVRIAIGTEFEFAVLPKHPGTMPNYGVPGLGAKGHGHRASAGRSDTDCNRHSWAPDSRRSSYSYLENNGESFNDLDKLETVFTHQPTDASGRPLPYDARIAPRVAEAWRHQLHAPASGYKPLDPSRGVVGENGHIAKPRPTDARETVAGWLKFRNQQINRIFTVASRRQDQELTNGMHLNISLHTLENETPLFRQPLGVDCMQSCLNQSMDLLSEGLHLLTPSDAAFDRWAIRSHPLSWHIWHKHVPTVQSKNGDKTCVEEPQFYIENRLASSEANPYYAVMLQMLAVYQGLKKDSWQLNDGVLEGSCIKRNPCTLPLLNGGPRRQELGERFLQGNKIRRALNMVEPGLGNAFRDAIAAMPPGTEQTMMDKNRASRGNAR